MKKEEWEEINKWNVILDSQPKENPYQEYIDWLTYDLNKASTEEEKQKIKDNINRYIEMGSNNYRIRKGKKWIYTGSINNKSLREEQIRRAELVYCLVKVGESIDFVEEDGYSKHTVEFDWEDILLNES